MIHKYLHFARHSLTTPLPHHSTASLSAFFAALHPLRNSSVTLLAFFAAKHLPSEPSGDTFALFCRPKPPVGTLRRHFCLFFCRPKPHFGTLQRHFRPFLSPCKYATNIPG